MCLICEFQRRYDVDMTPLSKPYQTECEKYFMRTANEWVNLSETDLCGNAAVSRAAQLALNLTKLPGHHGNRL